jgi:hypothetical protein
MMRTRFVRVAAIALALAAIVAVFDSTIRGAGKPLPDRLSDQEFWQMVADFSEPNGFFRSDNLLSNELGFPYVMTRLVKTAPAGRVYVGVGPEQNFNYIAGLKPRMAFIVDIRRGNLDLQLMYKALFELSANRAEFVSRLFSRKLPQGLNGESAVEEILGVASKAEASQPMYDENFAAILNDLTEKHHFALSMDDREGIEYVFRNFRTFGPSIQYSSSTGGARGGFQPTYAELMLSVDGDGMMRSYLATEENYSVLRQLEQKNLIVPLVGNFVGPKAIKSVGDYLTAHDALVSAFYLSNVEQFIGDTYQDFCRNVSSLPLDANSTFIRSVRGGRGVPQYGGLNPELGAMASEMKACAAGAAR